MELHSIIQNLISHLGYILPIDQLKLVPRQKVAMYNLSALVLFITTLITLDFDQEVPYTNYTTAFMPQFIFYIPVQAVGYIEHHIVLIL